MEGCVEGRGDGWYLAQWMEQWMLLVLVISLVVLVIVSVSDDRSSVGRAELILSSTPTSSTPVSVPS